MTPIPAASGSLNFVTGVPVVALMMVLRTLEVEPVSLTWTPVLRKPPALPARTWGMFLPLWGGPSETELTQRLRSEEHTSELQSHSDLVCRLLLEKKKKIERHVQLRYVRHRNQSLKQRDTRL